MLEGQAFRQIVVYTNTKSRNQKRLQASGGTRREMINGEVEFIPTESIENNVRLIEVPCFTNVAFFSVAVRKKGEHF